ncbi:hypothetical protein BU26DRAFT_500118 [Trematosphaeria pertusa]|uniref:Uncharacterized protein n=1 Tax=Trematosphaeria pertusa TaxID=390896 RepID=A0A6A6IWM5_9PLEO|nr:uncharacterized protein BU26DRAFT_500118 [Trematosphaeria pertusa]KAF2254342.1 hypothetical protein BU26DRAFT_500118 [Trematosphaeria pertusa]
MPTLAPAVSLLARAIGVTARLRVLFRARSVPCQQVGLCALSILHKLNLGYRHGDPRESQTPANPAVTCSKAEPDGGTYTKAGPQQVDGQTLNCNGGTTCDILQSVSVSVSSSLTNEKSVTHSQGDSLSVSMMAGYMILGPTATVTVGYTHDWSTALTEGMAMTDTRTTTKTLTLSIRLVPGVDFNAWFTPTLNCQPFKITCNDVEQSLEKCEPVRDSNGDPAGDSGIMAIG